MGLFEKTKTKESVMAEEFLTLSRRLASLQVRVETLELSAESFRNKVLRKIQRHKQEEEEELEQEPVLKQYYPGQKWEED